MQKRHPLGVSRRAPLLVLGIIGVAVLWLGWWLYSRRLSVEESAHRIAYHVMEGDFALMAKLTPEKDLTRASVSRADWERFLKYEVAPRLKRVKITQEEQILKPNHGLQGVFYFTASANSHNRHLMVMTETTGDDVVVPMVVWVSLFGGAISMIDLNIPDEEVDRRMPEIKAYCGKIMRKYHINAVANHAQLVTLP